MMHIAGYNRRVEPSVWQPGTPEARFTTTPPCHEAEITRVYSLRENCYLSHSVLGITHKQAGDISHTSVLR